LAPQTAQSEHFFPSGGVQLHGRLYTPAGRGPYPTILYVAGGGEYSLLTDAYAQNTAQAFVERGMAVFVFDKRGVGQSGGQVAPHDLIGKSGDVRAALDFLSQHPRVDQRRVIVWAISQAGWFAPQAIARRREVRGLILVSPPGLSPIDNSARLARRQLVAGGVTGADLEAALTLWHTLWRYLGNAENHEAARAMLEQEQTQPWFDRARTTPAWEGLPATAQDLLDPAALRRAWAERPDEFAWLREQANFADYAAVYRAVRQPVLLIFGSADTLIDPAAAREVFEQALAGRENVTVTTYVDAGHGIQARGDPEHPMPTYLAEITRWSLQRFER
jgi:pimeloyl-ACP methyl ester carboxylesterase